MSTSAKSHEIVCYLQIIMNNSSKYLFRGFFIFGLILSVIACSREPRIAFSEIVKVSLRDVGHHLLLTNQDSISLVKPVVTLEELKYQLSFEEQLSIQPDTLVDIIKNSFKKTDLPQHYLVEVLQCEDNEVAYSYEMKQNLEKGIIPCVGRQLPKGCYILTIRFTEVPEAYTGNSKLIYTLLLGILGFIVFMFYKQKPKTILEAQYENYAFIGRYKFYPEQNKLIKDAIEINLSRKECEILSIFIAQPNQIIKRDELTKKVWEDNGVFVGRSLDTYISKLRKKLQDDKSIKLTNVHGIGYKLEII